MTKITFFLTQIFIIMNFTLNGEKLVKIENGKEVELTIEEIKQLQNSLLLKAFAIPPAGGGVPRKN